MMYADRLDGLKDAGITENAYPIHTIRATLSSRARAKLLFAWLAPWLRCHVTCFCLTACISGAI